MRKIKRQLMFAGLCMTAVFSMAAWGASSAQATANLKINGKEVTEQHFLTSTGGAGFVLNVPAINLKIECNALTLDPVVQLEIDIPPRVVLFDFFVFLPGSGCKPLVGGKASACKTAESFEAKLKGSAFLHEGKTYERFEPETGTPLMKIQFTGAECALPEELSLTGKFVTESPGIETEEVTHKLFPLKTGLFSDELKLGKNQATIELKEGIGMMLASPNEGAKWSATA